MGPGVAFFVVVATLVVVIFFVVVAALVVVAFLVVVVAIVGGAHPGTFCPLVQQYFPFPPFSQQSLFVAPFGQQNGPLPPLVH